MNRRRVISPRRRIQEASIPKPQQHCYPVHKPDHVPYIPILFLIISSSDVPQYLFFRECASRYFSLFPNDLLFFFLECDPNLDCEAKIVNEHDLYVRGHDSIIPGIFDKTIKGMLYLDQEFSYDLLIRTNLSTFWDLHHVLEWKKNVPRTFPYAGGFLVFDDFISGTGIFLSPEAVAVLLQPSSLVAREREQSNDDVLLTRMIQAAGIGLQPIQNYKMQFLINGYEIIDHHEPILYYRIKNTDRNIDMHHFHRLMQSVYGIIT